jgi:hypothetical protein
MYASPPPLRKSPIPAILAAAALGFTTRLQRDGNQNDRVRPGALCKGESAVRLRFKLLAAMLCAGVAPMPSMAAQTFTGVLPPGTKEKILPVKLPAKPTQWHFRFYAPPVNAGVNYALGFCVGPRSNPCGLHSDIDFTVPKGQTRLATLSSTLFKTRVLTVGQGTNRPVPFSVTITP